MIKQIKKYFAGSSLAIRINCAFISIFVPVILLVCVWFWCVTHYNNEYDNLVKNASDISEFSIDFKSNFDYKIYLIIVGNKTFTAADPLSDIRNAEKVISHINLSQENYANKRRVEQIKKYLGKLKDYTEVICENVSKGNRYDENIQIWENDIETVTSLIQDNIQKILYYETREISNVRREMEQTMGRLIIISAVSIVFLAVFTFGMSFYISRTITRPIRYLQNLTEQVAGGNLDVRSKIDSGAEVKKLSDSLNIMIERISTLIDRVKVEQVHLREAELEILQMQINPHFLYNTLDTIVWLAEAGDQSQVVRMVEALSTFFRSSLNEGKDITSIGEELIHIKSYLQIQQVRYQDILEYEVRIPEELLQYSIPKITLQPLVENALYHGIKNKRGVGKIQVEGYQTQGGIVLVIKDNGIGMTQERLIQVQEGLQNPDRDNKDFYGLYNVNERLRLKYGEPYHLEIFSRYGAGTSVEVHLPRQIIKSSQRQNRKIDLKKIESGEVQV